MKARIVLLALGTAAVGAVTAASAAGQEAKRPIASWSRTRAVPQAGDSLAARGAAVFNNWCSACHGRDTEHNNAPGTQSLAYKYRGELPAALQDRKDLTVDAVKYYVRHGVGTMPLFRPTEVGDADLEALAAYLSKK